MPKRIIYQTLSDTGNPNEIEIHGAYKCTRKNAWLGEGYYFWESYIENAHWWGDHSYGQNYIICEAEYEFDENSCLNLVDNPEHNKDFHKSINLMKSQNLFTNDTTVARVLDFMRKVSKSFDKFKAIRVNGINSKNINSTKSIILKFEKSLPGYLDLAPPIQVCIIHKEIMKIKNFRVIHPSEYFEEYC